MKRFISIILIGTYLLSSTALVELLKVPDLIEHYADHVAESGDLSFIEFIHQHYSDEHSGDNSGHNHCRLPFKTHEQGNPISIYILSSVSFELPCSIGFAENTFINPENTHRVSDVFSAIWQPPQLF